MSGKQMRDYYDALDRALRRYHSDQDMEAWRDFYRKWQHVGLLPAPTDDQVMEIMVHKTICVRPALADIADPHRQWCEERGYFAGLGLAPRPSVE
jgi:hypothetical protein